MKLVRFSTPGGSVVWINPDHVCAVVDNGENPPVSKLWLNTSENDFWFISGPADEVVAMLEQPR